MIVPIRANLLPGLPVGQAEQSVPGPPGKGTGDAALNLQVRVGGGPNLAETVDGLLALGLAGCLLQVGLNRGIQCGPFGLGQAGLVERSDESRPAPGSGQAKKLPPLQAGVERSNCRVTQYSKLADRRRKRGACQEVSAPQR